MKKPIIEMVVGAPALALERSIELSEELGHSLAHQKPLQKAEEFWHTLGPGLTTGAADDDPSGIATYSQTGAQYGFQLLWLAAFTFPLMALVQEMCARIGLQTGRGLAANIRQHFPKWVLYSCTFLLFLANTLNIGADLGAMAKGIQLVLPGFNFAILIICFALFSLLLQIFTTYQKYARYLKWLALLLLSYVASALLSHLDWSAVRRHTLTPSLTFSKDQLFLICGILGTTISPYLFFWQTSQEVEEQILEGRTSLASRRGSSDQQIKSMRLDVWSGMFLSNVVMFFIIAACAATLFSQGIVINSAADAAAALRPIAGEGAYLLFALGIIATGLLAIPVLAGSTSYALAESFGWPQGLYRKLRQAYSFYGMIILSMLIGLLINFLGIDPIKALIYSAVANGIVAPVVLVLIVLISANHRVMAERVNRPLTTWLGWLVVLVMAVSGVAAIVSITT